MSECSIRYLVYVIKAGLFVLPILALLVIDTFFFPFIVTKNIFFRMVVEILFFLWVFVAVFNKKYRPKVTPLMAAIGLTMFFLTLATVFGENPLRSFWSNFERMEGLVTHLHLFVYFLILTSIFKTKKDWKWFFASMLVVSVIVTGYGFMQLFGKVAIHQSDVRLDASFGNATYLAIFLIFHLFLIGMFFYWYKQIWLRIVLAVLFVLELFIIFFTATRGAILGLLGGVFLFGLLMAIFSLNKKIRYGFAGLMAIVILTIGAFWLFKDVSFIKNHQVLSRFSLMSLTETTVASRFTIWGMSWQGFQDYPILGWGPENYNLVFNKYYESSLWPQEPWFDRSHNVFFDWLISAGLLGSLAYWSIFGTALYMIWKGLKKKYFGLIEAAGLSALFGAYIFHNLFVFDNLTSYFVFFSTLGFVQYRWTEKRNEGQKDLQKSEFIKEITAGQYLLITVVFLATVFSLYFVNIKPAIANVELLRTLIYVRQGASSEIILANFEKIFNYNTFANGEAREQLSGYAGNFLINQQVSDEEKQIALAKAVEAMEKQVAVNPDDIRYLVMINALYTKQGQFDKALETINRAIEISPNKQQLYFAKTDVYLSIGQIENAIATMKHCYSLDSSYEEASKNLAYVLILNGNREEAEKILMKHFNKTIFADQRFLNAYSRIEDFEIVKEIWLEFIRLEPNNPQYYVSLAATYNHLGQIEKAVESIEKAIEIEPRFKEQGEDLIESIRAGTAFE